MVIFCKNCNDKEQRILKLQHFLPFQSQCKIIFVRYIHTHKTHRACAIKLNRRNNLWGKCLVFVLSFKFLANNKFVQHSNKKGLNLYMKCTAQKHISLQVLCASTFKPNAQLEGPKGWASSTQSQASLSVFHS